MKKVPGLLFTSLLCASLFLSVSIAFNPQAVGAASNDQPTMEVSASVHHDISPPLRGMSSQSQGAEMHREKPLRTIPGSASNNLQTDPAVQSSATGPQVAATNGLNFAGVGNGDYGFSPNAAPPDTNGAVGATQYVQWVNESFAVFDKTTGKIAAGFPKAGNTLWQGFGGGCEANNDGDPIAQYDKAANR